MDVILQVLSVLFVVLWTARLAFKKRRHPLLWAGAAALPAIAVALIDALPEAVTILCMAPMVALVFVPARQAAPAEGEEDPRVNCPRCQHVHEPGPNFCTNCGWELHRPYGAEDGASETARAPEPTVASTTVEPTDAPVAEDPLQPVDATQSVLATEQVVDPIAVDTGPQAADMEAAPAFSAAPMKITRPLTASAMTEAGLTLFNQGRVREAVDQFTKAIALDPRYREAWENRAKAYDQLGLSDKAAADQAQLEAI